uniref:RAB39B, member RAS oncogene family b n=1 Tax=Neogobius melanostomus TaxID=47308 RepID=A0A8C6U1H8_9GOBI
MEAIWLYQFRLIVIGDSTVGKSCLIRRFTEGRFAQVSDPTVGVDFFSRLVEIEPGKRIKLQIWDTAGQERFRCESITRAYYRNSNVHDWLEEARSHVQPHSIVFLLVGHKCDLEPQRQVSRQEAEKLAGAYGMRYVETSARDAINVEHAFTELTREIFALVRSGDITIQEGWEGVKSGFVPNVVHSSEEVTKSDRRCLC